MESQASVNNALRNLGFNWMGGKIYVPDGLQPSGFRKLEHNDPWLDEHLNIESEQWYFFALDKKYYYCCALNPFGAFPVMPVRMMKSQIETVQVEPEALGEGEHLNRVNRTLIKDQDILTAPVNKTPFNIQQRGHVVGIQKFGVYAIGKDESAALRDLPRWVGMLGTHCFRSGFNDALARHLLDSGTKWIMDDLQNLGKTMKRQMDDPDSEINKAIEQIREP